MCGSNCRLTVLLRSQANALIVPRAYIWLPFSLAFSLINKISSQTSECRFRKEVSYSKNVIFSKNNAQQA